MFCSLGCPVSVRQRQPGVIEPAYVETNGSVTEGGLCYRGHYVAALMGHPKRLVEGKSRGAGEATYRRVYSTILAEASELLREASDNNSLGVMISGNLPTSEIAAAARFFQSVLPARNVSVYIPPTDTALLRGLARSKAESADTEDIKEAKTILAVGDILGTHPMLAQVLHDFREGSRDANLINIDTLKGRTMRFATRKIIINHGAEAHALLGLALKAKAKRKELGTKLPKTNDLFNISGIDQSEAESCIKLLREDNNSLIVLTLPTGRCRGGKLLAAAAGALAAATKSKILPLYANGGSPGGYAVCRALELTEPAAWLNAAREGEFSTVFSAGVDVAGMLPDDMAAEVLDEMKFMIAASAMPNATTSRADITLPLAFWFEMDGEVLDHQGRDVHLNALAQPPGGADTLVNLLNQIAEKSGIVGISKAGPAEPELADAMRTAAADIDRPLGEVLQAEDGTAEETFILTSRTENLDLYEGQLSRQLDWVLTIEPRPIVLMNPDDAAGMNVRDREPVKLERNGCQVELCAKLSNAVPAGTLAVTATIGATKGLFECNLQEGSLETGPARVKLSMARAEKQ